MKTVKLLFSLLIPTSLFVVAVNAEAGHRQERYRVHQDGKADRFYSHRHGTIHYRRHDHGAGHHHHSRRHHHGRPRLGIGNHSENYGFSLGLSDSRRTYLPPSSRYLRHKIKERLRRQRHGGRALCFERRYDRFGNSYLIQRHSARCR